MRKPRGSKSFRRLGPQREPYDRVLIVCEGAKTEPTYLRDLIKSHRLSSANVVIHDNTVGSAPKSVVNQALGLYKENYEKVYCVIDRDEHPTYADALAIIEEKKRKNIPIEAIVSNPCVEVWFLLHYEYSTACIARKGKKSPGDCAVTKLNKHIPGYAKTAEGLYVLLKPKQKEAIKNAKKLVEHHSKTGTDGNPSTQFHTLVEYLLNLKKS
jgi:hypothetical protein